MQEKKLKKTMAALNRSLSPIAKIGAAEGPASLQVSALLAMGLARGPHTRTVAEFSRDIGSAGAGEASVVAPMIYTDDPDLTSPTSMMLHMSVRGSVDSAMIEPEAPKTSHPHPHPSEDGGDVSPLSSAASVDNIRSMVNRARDGADRALVIDTAAFCLASEVQALSPEVQVAKNRLAFTF